MCAGHSSWWAGFGPTAGRCCQKALCPPPHPAQQLCRRHHGCGSPSFSALELHHPPTLPPSNGTHISVKPVLFMFPMTVAFHLQMFTWPTLLFLWSLCEMQLPRMPALCPLLETDPGSCLLTRPHLFLQSSSTYCLLIISSGSVIPH